MFKFIVSFVLILSSVYAKDIVVYDGEANYKGQLGGGKYELADAEYFKGENNDAFMLKLTFEKKSGKFVNQEQETTITGRIINARQILIDNENGSSSSYTVGGCDGSSIAMDRFFGNIVLKMGICE